MNWRTIIVGLLALFASAQVIRSAWVAALVDANPAAAAKAWPGNPQVKLATAMADIAQSAASGSPVPQSALARAQAAARTDPLATEPFLIKGALAKSRGQEATAERLFTEARARDPRSAAARYFLAERYLRSGRPMEGLNESSVLARLVPGGSQLIIPALAEYARTDGAVPYLRRMFQANPELERGVLNELSTKAENAALVMSLAPPPQTVDGPAPEYQARLLGTLVDRGRFALAYALWNTFTGTRPSPSPGVFNGQFRKLSAPAPFNWTFASSGAGVAEPAERGRLSVSFYGRENVDLASQLVMLRAGSYAIRMLATGELNEGAAGLDWSLTCLPGNQVISTLPVVVAAASASAGKKLAAQFKVPDQGCDAQWLKLKGTAQEFEQTYQLMITDFAIVPAARP